MKRLVCLGLICSFLLTGCGADLMSGSVYQDHIYVDKKTGVNYIWINTNSGVTISPRYNADGTLYVEK